MNYISKSYSSKLNYEYCKYFAPDNADVLEIGYNISSNEIIYQIVNGKNINIHGSNWDLIILSNTIDFIPDVQLLFAEIKKMCNQHTRIIIFHHSYLWEPLLNLRKLFTNRNQRPVQNWLTPADVKNLLFLENFEVYRNTRRTLLPLNIPFISAFLNKWIANLPFFNLFALNNVSFARMLPNTESFVKRDFSVSIVVPVRNEAGNVVNIINQIPEFGLSQEIIFIEGNSLDDSKQAIQNVVDMNYKNRKILSAQQNGSGKADAVWKGFEMATGDILMILDSDLSVPPADLKKFYDLIAAGKGEFINGCRLVYPMEKQAMRFLNVLGNKFFSMVFSWILNQPIKDTLCGTKVLFREDYYKIVENRSFFGNFDPFGDFDLLFGAYKLNLRIVELPIRYRERTYGSTNISRFKHGLMLLRMCIFAARKIKFV